jgi:hypothetical protein
MMDQLPSVLLTINNYLHDMATVMLMASGVVMWYIVRRFENTGSPEARSLMFSLYDRLSKVVTVSLIWIAAGAVPRILTFSTFESANALAEGRLPGLIVTQIVAFLVVIGGACIWISLIRRVKEIKGRS